MRMSAKFGRRLFPHSSVILITDRTTEGRKEGRTEWQNDHMSSAWSAEVIKQRTLERRVIIQPINEKNDLIKYAAVNMYSVNFLQLREQQF